MGEHFPPQAIIIVSQTFTNSLRILKNLVPIHFTDSRYHTCTFFFSLL